MEMNVHPMKQFGEPNEERTGDDWMQDKQALSGCCVLSCLTKGFITSKIFSMHLKSIARHFGKYTHLLSCQMLHENTDNTLMSFGKNEAGASSWVA